MRIRLSLAVLAAVSLGLGGASAAVAGPIEDLIGGPGPSPSQGIVNETLGYVLDLVAIGDTNVPVEISELVSVPEVAHVPVAAIVNEVYAPLDGPVRNQHNNIGDSLDDAVVIGHVGAERFLDVVNTRLGGAADQVNDTCGACAPGLGGPIGPLPIGPVGDEARALVNAGIDLINGTYASAGQRINSLCGHCAPGLGGPIGPLPIGPVGDDDGPA